MQSVENRESDTGGIFIRSLLVGDGKEWRFEGYALPRNSASAQEFIPLEVRVLIPEVHIYTNKRLDTYCIFVDNPSRGGEIVACQGQEQISLVPGESMEMKLMDGFTIMCQKLAAVQFILFSPQSS